MKIKIKFGILIILLLLSTNAIAEPEGDTPTIIKITVTDEGSTIKDAKVALFENNTQLYSQNTNNHGGVLFLLTLTEQKEFTINVSKMGFLNYSKNFIIIPEKENAYEIELKKPQEIQNEPYQPEPDTKKVILTTNNETLAILEPLQTPGINLSEIPMNATPEEILELFKKKNITLENFDSEIGTVVAGEEFYITTIPGAKVMYANLTKYADENGKVNFTAVEGYNILIITKGNYTSIVPITAEANIFKNADLGAETDENEGGYLSVPLIWLIAAVMFISLLIIFLIFKRTKK